MVASWESATVRGEPEPLPTDLRDRLLSIQYTDKTRGADEATFVFDNADLAMFDDPRLAKGNKLIVAWGYAHEMGPNRTFTIRKFSGWSKLSVSCISSSESAFIGRQRTHMFYEQAPHEVAEVIARQMGFTRPEQRDIEAIDIPRRDITQAGENDYAFLTRLAAEHGFIFRIAGGVFNFHPPRIGANPVMTLIYFSDRIGWFAGEPRLEEGDLGVPGRVTVRGRSAKQRSTVEGTAGNDDDTGRDVQGSRALLVDPGSGTTTPGMINRTDVQDQRGNTPAQDDATAQNQARSQFRRGERSVIKLSLPLVGMPNLSSDEVIRLEGVRERLTGNYSTEEIAHSVGSGYTMRVKVERNAESRTAARTQQARDAERRELAAIRQELAALQEQRDAGTITQEEFDTQSRELSRREHTAREQARRAASGRENPTTTTDPDEMERVVHIDPATGTRVVTYRPRGSETDAGTPATPAGRQ